MNRRDIFFVTVLGLAVANGYVIYKYNQPEQQQPFPDVIIEEPVEIPKPEDRVLTLPEALETIDINKLKTDLGFLASDELEGRMSGKRGNETAANYIEKEFKTYGLETGRQRFKIARMNPGPHNELGNDYTENIYGILKGKSDKYIIVGAHMDHIGYGPAMSRTPRKREIHNGADDNASGSATIMEIARAMSQMEKPNYTYIFICFSAEEMGLIGARHYVSDPVLPLNDNLIMVNFDMVGYLRGTLNAYGADHVPVFDDIVKNLDQKYTSFKVNGRVGSGGSDHAIFANRAKKPVIFFHTGGHQYYHTPDDDANRINYQGLVEIAQFALEMLWTFDQNGQQMIFKALYEGLELDEVHDHGIQEMRR